jgi:hypothetical protein
VQIQKIFSASADGMPGRCAGPVQPAACKQQGVMILAYKAQDFGMPPERGFQIPGDFCRFLNPLHRSRVQRLQTEKGSACLNPALAGRICRSDRLKSCREGNPASGGITVQGAFSFVTLICSQQILRYFGASKEK